MRSSGLERARLRHAVVVQESRTATAWRRIVEIDFRAHRLLAAMTCLVILALPASCIRVSVGTVTPPTLGEQILDLAAAREAGELTASEYKRARTLLIGDLANR